MRKLYARDSLGVYLNNAVYALDSTTIDQCFNCGKVIGPLRQLVTLTMVVNNFTRMLTLAHGKICAYG